MLGGHVARDGDARTPCTYDDWRERLSLLAEQEMSRSGRAPVQSSPEVVFPPM